jgi:hypothetical protein
MINIFGEEEFKPLVRFGKIIPDYFISKDGRVYSTKSNKFIYVTELRESNGRLKSCKVDVVVPEDLFEDFTHSKRGSSSPRMSIALHRGVMETYKSIDEYPPIPKEDWDKCPESAKQWIRDTAIIDHKNDDPSNNHVDNLKWVIPKDNNPYRKVYKND